ncbi:Rv2231c family pyridoxal phosphate-dependent protein CobC [Haloechinothrix sp. LS1_15]|uniref:Rv2231c family pyridoxal phosphate-dependent protein CobC n=1 Tax=Haloechinothrix sp. LS1_15 TaxID=2652248 RepID=UPI002944DAC1|nr:Rv2231c family pyridoxal phosphate-dependent protein CobC [Haloechinothrix sp. LS1_15]MDV6013724.1 threonine-phosphate decarboxylase [Haloechinothrix sp. LS1_15]
MADTGDRDLRHHGDQDIADGLVDLAVNVRLGEPPAWLREELTASLHRLAAYPDVSEATKAVAARHGRSPDEVLVTSGAAEAFTLLARALRPRHSVIVHPQFTEPDVALHEAGHCVEHVILDAHDGFRLRPEKVPADADLVVVGNPTNPTSVLHPAGAIRRLCRPGRVVVVDEAFADAVPGEPETLSGERAPGVLVIRSLTKTWGIAGLRAGYVLGEPELVEQLRAAQPPWSVSTPAAAAVVACTGPAATAQADELAVTADADRKALVEGLARLEPLGVRVAGQPRAPFVLVTVPEGERVRLRLRELGYAVRRGDTFPGLSSDWMRIAVRDPATTRGFLDALAVTVGWNRM